MILGMSNKPNDAMQKYYERILEADVIILSTPVYWANISAQLKAFIHRFYALNCDRL